MKNIYVVFFSKNGWDYNGYATANNKKEVRIMVEKQYGTKLKYLTIEKPEEISQYEDAIKALRKTNFKITDVGR